MLRLTLKTTHIKNYNDAIAFSNCIFARCSDLKNSAQEFVSLSIEYLSLLSATIKVTLADGTIVSYDKTNITSLSTNASKTITFTCDEIHFGVSSLNDLIEEDIIDVGVDGYTTLYCYKQNSENDVLNKSLTLVNIFDGEFNHQIGLKNLNIDIYDYPIFRSPTYSYNYVYIPKLKRYYYVDSIEFISSDITRLHLKEDVLMSWQTLIKSQQAFVTRYENSTETDLVDDRLPLKDVLQVTYPQIVGTSTGSVKNATLNSNNSSMSYFLVSYISNAQTTTSGVVGITKPTNSNLNDLFAFMGSYDRINFLTFSELGLLISACQHDSASASYLKTIVALPFDPRGVYFPTTDDDSDKMGIYLGNQKILRVNGRFEDSSSTQTEVKTYCSFQRACPYIITADFTITNNSPTYLDFEPYCYYELYIAFVGWVKLNGKQILNKRLILYYTIDATTGNGTANLYNMTDKILVWASNCQVGVKIDFTTSNALEIARDKQANELNTIMGMLSSALSVGAGVVTQNPIAVAGGVLSAGKVMASYVNRNNMLFERAQTSFGTSEGVLHTSFFQNGVVCRTTRRVGLSSFSSSTYEHLQGLPYNNYVSDMSSLTGYVEIGEIHFDPKANNIYQDEITEIVELLQNGVIF